jgi:hypothetical protein
LRNLADRVDRNHYIEGETNPIVLLTGGQFGEVRRGEKLMASLAR